MERTAEFLSGLQSFMRYDNVRSRLRLFFDIKYGLFELSDLKPRLHLGGFNFKFYMHVTP